MVITGIIGRATTRRPTQVLRRLVPRATSSTSSPIFSSEMTPGTTINRRSMVMVTKTKPSDLLSPDGADDTDVSPTTTIQYNHLSDALNVTPSCLNRVERLINLRQSQESTDENLFLRVFVDAGGCSGFTYQFEIDTELDEEEDIVVISLQDDSNTPRVVIDEASLGFMEGSTLDYVQEMIKSAFEVKENPQSESACGCGSSFALKNFAANPAVD